MRIELLHAWIDALTMEETVAQVANFVAAGKPHQVITLNPEYLYRAQENKEWLDLVNQVDLVTPDGTGIVWAAKQSGQPVPERVTGIDLMLHLCKLGAKKGWRVYLFGAAPGVAAEAAAKLEKTYPGLKIAGTRNGYFNKEETSAIVAEIRQAAPHLLFVGLGMPKQEMWIAQNLKEMNVPVSIGIGGSFDVVSGRKERAPQWTQKLHLEWLYRLAKEPSRWQRQLVLPKFALLVLKRYALKK